MSGTTITITEIDPFNYDYSGFVPADLIQAGEKTKGATSFVYPEALLVDASVIDKSISDYSIKFQSESNTLYANYALDSVADSWATLKLKDK